MKLEIVKETKLNGDVYYCIEKDGVYVPDTMKFFVPNFRSEEEILEDLKKVINRIKGQIQIGKESIYSEEI